MTEQARVYSINALRDARAALIKFQDEVAQTIAGVDADVGRVGQWLSSERPAYWKHEIRKREDAVGLCHAAVMRKRIIQAPAPASIVEERKALQKAQRHLGEAQERAAKARHWAGVWDREAQMYKASCSGLSETLQRDIPAAIARLDRMIIAIEQYTGLRPDDGEEPGAAAAADVDAPHRFAHLRGHGPTADDRRSLAPETLSQWRWQAGDIPPPDGESLGRLAVAGAAPRGDQRVVFSWRALECTAVCFLRQPPVDDGDTGWYIGPVEKPEITAGYRAVTVDELCGHAPSLRPVLSLGVGTALVLSIGVIRSVLDTGNRDLWSADTI